VGQEAQQSIPRQLRLPELGAPQQKEQEARDESVANPDQPVPVSMPPESPNGSAG